MYEKDLLCTRNLRKSTPCALEEHANLQQKLYDKASKKLFFVCRFSIFNIFTVGESQKNFFV